MPVIHCKNCGKPFHRCTSQIYRNFCGPACRALHRVSRWTVSCAHCGRIVTRKPSRIAKFKLNFCGQACYWARKLATRSGCINHEGYRVIGINGKAVKEHRLVMEQHLGRKLLPSEVVHHKDGDRLNNSISNLVILSPGAHTQEHLPLTWNIERAKAMRAKGLSFETIGKALGVTGKGIRLVFIRRGLPLSTPGLRVSGYTRHNGIYVAPYVRREP
jgi:HNH endonuclease